MMAINSAIGLFYYFRVILAVFSRPEERGAESQTFPSPSAADHVVLAVLLLFLLWIGLYPEPLIDLLRQLVIYQ